MKGESLLRAVGGLDEALLERSEAAGKPAPPVWVKWGSLAACLCLVFAAALVLPRSGGEAPADRDGPVSVPGTGGLHTELSAAPQRAWEIVYNQVATDVATDAMDPDSDPEEGKISGSSQFDWYCITGREMTRTELDAAAPPVRPEWMEDLTGAVLSYGWGELDSLCLGCSTPWGGEVTITLRDPDGLRAPALPGEADPEPAVSRFNDFEFTAYERLSSEPGVGWSEVWAEFTLDGVDYAVSVSNPQIVWAEGVAPDPTEENGPFTLEDAKSALYDVLVCYAAATDAPDLSAIDLSFAQR